MSASEQINGYLSAQPEAKRRDLEALHRAMLELEPTCRLWFLDGKNEAGKVVSNPSVGYGSQIMAYADGKTREFYQVGLSANTAGISVYLMGLEDKTYLPREFGDTLGKASISGYCIKFKALKDIKLEVLLTAIRYGFEHTSMKT